MVTLVRTGFRFKRYEQTPGRVFKGKKMCGHMGAVKTTVQNLTIHSIM